MKTKAYACYCKEDGLRLQSSSGGIYPVIARKILEEGGMVFAACYNENMEVYHQEIRNLTGILKSQGSKYVASHLLNTFQMVLRRLEEGKKVLFAGTPCQCEGLLNCVSDHQQERLLCVDFICHGIPGYAAWRGYQSALKKYIDVRSINMRDKTSGWTRGEYSWKFTDVNGKKILESQKTNIYMKGFIDNLFLRPSCFECWFKGVERNTDITLGDYWGVWDIQPEMDDNKGTSLILVHSAKGQQMLNLVKEDLVLTDAVLEKAIRSNPSVVNSAQITVKRKEFYRRMQAGEDFITVVKDLTSLSMTERMANRVKKYADILKRFFSGGGLIS